MLVLSTWVLGFVMGDILQVSGIGVTIGSSESISDGNCNTFIVFLRIFADNT